MKTKLTGIYLIKNKINGHCYVGQSVDIKTRGNSHKNRSSNKYLMNAIQKYGLINFGFYVIKLCERQFLSKGERYYLERITCDCSNCFNKKPHYNLEMSVNDSYTMSEETKQIMSEKGKGDKHPNGKGGWSINPEKRKEYNREGQKKYIKTDKFKNGIIKYRNTSKYQLYQLKRQLDENNNRNNYCNVSKINKMFIKKPKSIEEVLLNYGFKGIVKEIAKLIMEGYIELEILKKLDITQHKFRLIKEKLRKIIKESCDNERTN